MPARDTAPWGYGPLAALAYELDKPVGRSLDGDVDFYRARLEGTAGPVLEPAVGTGRVLIPLLEDGLDVHGYDTSVPMLEHCRANCARRGLRPRLFEADLTGHRDPGAYAAAVIPAGSFSLLSDRDAARTALELLHANLAAGGRLILDLEPPPCDDHGLDPLRYWWNGGELVTLTVWHSETDPVAQRLTQWLRYESWRRGALERTEVQIFSLLWFGLAEFTDLLGEAGFAEVAVHGGYRAGSAPEPEDRIWTFEAVRG